MRHLPPTLFLALVLAALSACAAGQRERPLDEVRLQLKWQHQFQFAGYYAAQEKGFYREAGLSVSLLTPDGGEDPAQAVLDGRAEYGIGTSDLLLLRARGYPVVALAPVFQHSPLVLLASAREGIESVHDLAGRSLALEPQAAEIEAYLEREGLALSALTLAGHDGGVAALLDGRVAAMSAYSTDEPFALKAAGFDYRLFSPRSGGIDFYGDTLFTTEAEILAHPARVRAFRTASLKGWRYALDHPEEIIELILARYGTRHSREHLAFEARETRRLIAPEAVPLGHLNPGRWQHIAQTYAGLGLMPAEVSLAGFLYPPALR